MKDKYYWDVEAVVTTPVRLKIIASDEQEALQRASDGAWHGCQPMPKSWDKATVVSVGSATRTKI